MAKFLHDIHLLWSEAVVNQEHKQRQRSDNNCHTRSPYNSKLNTMTEILNMRISALILVGTCTAASAQSVEVPLWPGPGVEKDVRVISINHDGPCGPVAFARITKLPSPNTKGPLQSERVVELSSLGTVLRTWPKPVDYDVLGIVGTQLLVAPYGDKSSGLLVANTGRFSVTVPPTDRPSPTLYQCPRIPTFGNSAYVRCHEIKDLKNKKTRRLAYDGPCT